MHSWAGLRNLRTTNGFLFASSSSYPGFLFLFIALGTRSSFHWSNAVEKFFCTLCSEILSRRWQKSNKFHPGVHNSNLITTHFQSEALGSRAEGLSQCDASPKVYIFVRQFIFVKEPSHTLSLSIYVEGLSLIPKPDKEGETNSRSALDFEPEIMDKRRP